MVAVLGLDDDALDELRPWLASRGVALANDNAPGQVVLAGPHDALEAATSQASSLGARCRRLPVEGAFHSPAMTSAMVAVDTIARRLTFADPALPWISGGDGRAVVDAAGARRVLIEGVLAPVRWRAVQTTLVERGIDRAFEVGPGGVLRGLARRSIPGVPVQVVDGTEALVLVAEQTPTQGREVPAWA
jgi:[acyl-carrier-protein] S-malonyltransferase